MVELNLIWENGNKQRVLHNHSRDAHRQHRHRLPSGKDQVEPSKSRDYPPPTVSKTPQNIPQTLNTFYYPLSD